MSSLRDRLAAVLAESATEIDALRERRAGLQEEREREVAAVRERFAQQLADIDAELTAAEKIRKALEGPKPREPKSEPEEPARTQRFRPGDEKLLAVLQAMAEGKDMISGIAEGMPFSRATTENAVIALREDGSVRLKGERKAPGGHAKARTYGLTPAGREAIEELTARMANGAHA